MQTTAQRSTVTPPILDVAPPFARSLRAENKSPKTVTTYLEAVHGLAAFPELGRNAGGRDRSSTRARRGLRLRAARKVHAGTAGRPSAPPEGLRRPDVEDRRGTALVRWLMRGAARLPNVRD
jgi:hypothetical protein